MNYKIFGGFLIILALVIIGALAYRNSRRAHEPIVYSDTFMLNALWQSYQKNYLDPQSGRTLDKQDNNITTSEGESYTMLRAVWDDDQAVFNQSWQWTQENLQRPQDHLFSWLYGQNSNGSYGILTGQGGQNTATDADTDIALALVLASRRWQDNAYMQQAQQIIPEIWKQEVVTAKGVPYVTADNTEQNNSTEINLDPSYFSPYAYRIFAQIDAADPWSQAIDSSYSVLEQSMALNLDKTGTAELPPDWVAINRQTGQLEPATGSGQTSNYGYDALRVPFRLALDYQWNQDPRDKQILQNMNFLGQEWQSKGMLDSTYTHDGQVVFSTEAPSMYGGAIGYFIVADSSQAQNVYTSKLQSLYNADSQDWNQQLSYYDDNWAWFGIALYNGKLINYSASGEPQS